MYNYFNTFSIFLEICQIDLNRLVKAGMITIDQNIAIKSTQIGQIMANYYVAFETMKLFTQVSKNTYKQLIVVNKSNVSYQVKKF